MDGLSKEDVFHLNEEIDRMDTSVFDSFADIDGPAEEPVPDELVMDE